MSLRRGHSLVERIGRGITALSLGLVASALSACSAPAAPAAPAAPIAAGSAPPRDTQPAAPLPVEGQAFDVELLDYDASIQLAPDAGAISGVVRIAVKSRIPAAVLDLAAEEMVIDAVREGAQPRAFTLADGRLRIPLGDAQLEGARVLEITYHGSPTKGLHFKKEAVYTIFHTGRWLPSSDVPGDKATLTLQLTLPAGLHVVASGSPRSREPLPGGLERHTFRLETPHSAYLFGFAAGKFQEVTATAGKVRLSFLSAERTPAELLRVFADTPKMLQFFEERAGVPYRFERYAQVLIPGASPQELAGFAVLPARYADDVLGEPREDWLIAHELAHQWWGNLVTCAGWSDFWMNEAFATYMVAAYKERRWGRDEYDREIELSRRRYLRIREKGADRPLALSGPARPSDVEGPISYAKGSAVLHFLRHQIGDAAFWAGMKAFIASNAGGAVTTGDLKLAMEKASGQDLDDFFKQWVYGAGVPDVVVRHREEGRKLLVEIEQQQADLRRVPLQIAIETDAGRERRSVLLVERKQALEIPLAGALRSVRADDGGHLPFAVRHERPIRMLLHQVGHEPDVAGRADALLRVSEACKLQGAGGASDCAPLRDVLKERAKTDASRLVRKLVQDALAP
jgi:aminopeptidase N